MQESNEVVTVEDDLIAAMVPTNYKPPEGMTWALSQDIKDTVKDLPWAAEAFKGAASFNQVTFK